MAAALATLVSCGNSDDSTGAKASAPQSTGSSAGPVGSPMITPSPTSATPTPPTPSTTRPPVQTAKDGQNYKACSDGNCEVLIRKAASFTLSGERVKVTVVDGTVKITMKDGYVSISGGGFSSWSNADGPRHTASLNSADGNTAVLRVMTH